MNRLNTKDANEHVVMFTHNDLDALGSVIVAKEIIHKFEMQSGKKYDVKYFHTNYQDIGAKVAEIEAYVMNNDVKLMIISDVSFGDNMELMTRLYNLNISTIFCDHHLYGDNPFVDFPKWIIKYDKERCATKIIFDDVLQTNTNPNLELFIKIIDVYDIWQKYNKFFPLAQKLNEYFWYLVREKNMTIDAMADMFKSINYELPEDFKRVVDMVEDGHNQVLKEYTDKGLIKISKEHKTSLHLGVKAFQQFVMQQHDLEQIFVVGITSYGVIKFRINDKNPFSEEELRLLRIKLMGTSSKGHELAFTWKSERNFNNYPVESLMEEAKNVTSIIIDLFQTNKLNQEWEDDIPF